MFSFFKLLVVQVKIIKSHFDITFQFLNHNGRLNNAAWDTLYSVAFVYFKTQVLDNFVYFMHTDILHTAETVLVYFSIHFNNNFR